MTEGTHFDQVPRRRAEFIKPQNPIKAKVGSGGLSDDILTKAQMMLETNTTDFAPLAEMYLNTLANAIDAAKHVVGVEGEHETEITGMIYPTMQLKANGGMFHFPLVTLLADKEVQFLEVIDRVDADVIDLISAFIITIRAVLASKIRESNNPQAQELLFALDGACRRYFARHPENRNPL